MNKQMTNALSSGDNTPVVLISADGQVNSISSREVAEMMEVEHSKLLRKIDTINESFVKAKIGFYQYWEESSYINEVNNKPCREFQVTKLGCEFLANKCTGDKGVIFTHKYIKRFHQMEDYIKEKQNPNIPMEVYSRLSPELQAIFSMNITQQEHEDRISNLEDNIHIDRLQKKKIRDFISDVVKNTCGSKYSNAYKELNKKVYSSVYHHLYNYFGITSFEEIPKIKFQEALNVINAYKPNRELELMIIGANKGVD